MSWCYCSAATSSGCARRIVHRCQSQALLYWFPLLPPPQLGWQEGTGSHAHSCSCPHLVHPCSSACKMQIVQAREGKAKLLSVPGAALRENPEGSLHSALSTPSDLSIPLP